MSGRRRKPVVGVCAMDAKARSKPMRAILSRLSASADFDICVFGDKTILDDPVQSWPRCDFLIAFHSRGFPTFKVIEYVQETGVYCVNDVQMQLLLMDRRVVGAVLDAVDVPTPRRLWTRCHEPPVRMPVDLCDAMSRDFGIILSDLYDMNPNMLITATLSDTASIIVNDERMALPVVEKPANAEDHNINVLLDTFKHRRLFRKVGNRSSELIVDEKIVLRHDQDYVYEEALLSQQDIKVYTVGPHYIYGESRKAPTVDGVVERNADGKEVRRPITLTKQEQEIAKRICMAFGQTVCGLDMIRLGEGRGSVVIDVNGWSFVKGNDEYYDKCAMILRDTFLRVSRRSLNLRAAVTNSLSSSCLAESDEWRLERYVSVLRHADRTPKEKFKYTLRDDVITLCPGLIEPGRQLVELHDYSLLLSFLQQRESEHEDLFKVIKEKARLPGVKVQLHHKPEKSTVSVSVKWGGDITHAGRHQARELGDSMRTDLILLFGKGRNTATGNNGNGTFRDVTILNTDTVRVHGGQERRVQATATVFAKALLSTAELPSDFVSVDSWSPSESNTIAAKCIIDGVKDRMTTKCAVEMEDLLRLVSSTKVCLDKLRHDKIGWCCGESATTFADRWSRLLSSFKGDPSRIFDLYDSLKYDQIHHRQHLQRVFGSILTEFIDKTQRLFDKLSGSQYGETEEEQLKVAHLLSGPLLKTIINTLSDNTARQFSFFFTKESHIRCIYNVLRTRLQVPTVGELDYLSQVEFEVYSRRNGMERELRVSVRQGAHLDCLSAGFLGSDRDHALRCQQRRLSSPFKSLDSALTLISR